MFQYVVIFYLDNNIIYSVKEQFNNANKYCNVIAIIDCETNEVLYLNDNYQEIYEINWSLNKGKGKEGDKMIHYVTFKDEVLPGTKVNSLENVEVKEGMKGFIYQNRLVLFGNRISLYQLKKQYYYNTYYLDFIKKLEENNINFVCEYCNGFYESMENGVCTYEELKKEIRDNLDYQKISESEVCHEYSETDQEFAIVESLKNLNDAKVNKILIPFVLSLINKLDNGLSSLELIDYLNSLDISESLIAEIISLVALHSENGEDLLNTWNETYSTSLNFEKECIELTRK